MYASSDFRRPSGATVAVSAYQRKDCSDYLYCPWYAFRRCELICTTHLKFVHVCCVLGSTYYMLVWV